MLLKNEATVDFIHFATAIERDRLEIFDLLMSYNPDISYEDAMEIATYHSSFRILGDLETREYERLVAKKKAKKLKNKALEISRKRAADVIHKNLLHAHYRPEGVGYYKAMDDFKTRMSELPQQ